MHKQLSIYFGWLHNDRAKGAKICRVGQKLSDSFRLYENNLELLRTENKWYQL